MNYYERIQKAIDYIEGNLENHIDLEIAAQKAFMALSNFYRMFFALVGYSIKEYIRLRRISLAASEIIKSNICVIDIAVKYDFESGDSFSRAFRRVTGFLPSVFRRENKEYSFERINIMDKYFEVQDKELLNKYPDIKVLKQIEPVRVAYYCYFGKSPESNAFIVMRDWITKSGLKLDEQKHRIFGYDNPSPSSPEQDVYGYEVCVTIEDEFIVDDPIVKTKILEGGLYAVTGVKRDGNGDIGNEIMKVWQRFQNWISDSKYVYGGHQWLEEHLGFDEDFNHIGGIDLYMPVKLKKDMTRIILTEDTDAKDLRDIAVKAFEDDNVLYGAMPPDIDSIEWHKFNIKSGMYYKIIYDSNIVGGIKLFYIGDGHYRLGTIYISPEYQNKNIGTEVIRLIESQYPQAKKWSLDTPYKNYRNHHFYEKLGYVKVGEERPQQKSEFTLFIYEKCL